MDVRKERAIEEIEAKAEKIALRWFEKNYERVFKNPHLNPEQIPKNAEKLYNEIVVSRKRMIRWQKENDEKMRQERKAVQKPREIPVYSEEEMSRGPMYPVPEEVRQVLYSGVSHNDEGRAAYLRTRYEVSPDKRYYESQSWGMDMGWDVRRRAWPAMKEHAKSAIVKNSFYRRTGALDGDDPDRKQPFSAAHITVEIL